MQQATTAYRALRFFSKAHCVILYIQLFLQEIFLNIYLVPSILLIDMYGWKGETMKDIFNMKFVFLKIVLI